MKSVDQESSGTQIPWYESAIIGNFAIGRRAPPSPAATSPSSPPATTSQQVNLPNGIGITQSGIKYTDLVVGKGLMAKRGSRVIVRVKGVRANNEIFTNIDRLNFIVGSSQVLTVIDEGVVSMRVGGRRILATGTETGYDIELLGLGL